MASKGNERMLTFSAITEIAGTEAHEHVEEIEIVFAHYEDVEAQALRRCWGLKTLTLTNCKLTRIPSLTLVRESLIHLCLSAQAITRMEALDLPHLRKLYLQQNLIERIEGLEQCRKLQTLWLYGNRITQIENMSSCSDLRELGLQDNLITTLQCENGTGLDALVNLERLFLAKNGVRNVDDLQVLRQLPILHELSFSDAHFGSNLVVRHPEYRSLAMASLRQLQSLDGIGIEDSERAVVVDAFLSKTLTFNDKIAELTLQYEHDMRTIETRKQRGRSNAEMLQRELVEALNDIEQCVLQGQKELEEEKERQTKLREQNAALFAENVENLRSRWHEIVDQQLQEELHALEKEELLFDVLEQEAAAAENLALTIATLQCTHPDTIAFQHLPQHVPDYRYISSLFELRTSCNGSLAGQSDITILQMYRYYHKSLIDHFSGMRGKYDDRVSRLKSKELSQWFVVVSEDDAMNILQRGFSDSTKNECLILCSSPLQAIQSVSGPSGRNASSNNGSEASMESYLVLACRVFVEAFAEDSVQLAGDALSQASILAIGTTSLGNHPPGSFLQVKIGDDGMVLVTKRCALVPVLPEFVVLCSRRLGSVIQEPENIVAGDSKSSPEDLFVEFQQQLDEDLRHYHERVWKEIDPAVWTRTIRRRSELEQLKDETENTKRLIDQEKRAQRQLVKSIKRQQQPRQRER